VVIFGIFIVFKLNYAPLPEKNQTQDKKTF
jgi:hypothetical protein